MITMSDLQRLDQTIRYKAILMPGNHPAELLFTSDYSGMYLNWFLLSNVVSGAQVYNKRELGQFEYSYVLRTHADLDCLDYHDLLIMKNPEIESLL